MSKPEEQLKWDNKKMLSIGSNKKIVVNAALDRLEEKLSNAFTNTKSEHESTISFHKYPSKKAKKDY